MFLNRKKIEGRTADVTAPSHQVAQMSKSTNSIASLSSLVDLRWLVAVLGSKRHAAWWDCSFLDETGIKFLANSFPRSAVSAAFHATTEAAQRIHDAALGRIGCYHLFRLPLRIEGLLLEPKESGVNFSSKENALAQLATMASAKINAPEGPVQIGVENRILTDTCLSALAGHYHSAFTKGIRCFPYFSAES